MLATVGLATLAVSVVDAHGYVSNPKPRCLTIPGHPMFSLGCQSDGYQFADCRDGEMVGPVQVTWVEGQEIDVDVFMTAFHGGWHELRFCEDPRGGNDCFSRPGHQAFALPATNVQGCPEPAPSSTATHRGSCIPSPAECRGDLGPSSASYRFRLPMNISGDHVAMQWWWITNNGVPEHFKSCHDVRIIAAPPTPAPPTLPPTPPTQAPPTFLPTPRPPTPPPTICTNPGQLCKLDGTGNPCCQGYSCNGSVNWATCEVGSNPSPTSPPTTRPPTSAPPAPTAPPTTRPPTSAPPAPTAPPTTGPPTSVPPSPTVPPTNSSPPGECLPETRTCFYNGSGTPCCPGLACTGSINWATCTKVQTCIPSGQLCQYSGGGTPCCSGLTCTGSSNWATCQ